MESFWKSSASLVFCLSYKATFNLFALKKVHLKSLCLILWAFDKNYYRKVHMHVLLNWVKRLYTCHNTLIKTACWNLLSVICSHICGNWKIILRNTRYVFQEILTWKLRKSSFWPQKLGVDSYTGSTDTLVNTVCLGQKSLQEDKRCFFWNSAFSEKCILANSSIWQSCLESRSKFVVYRMMYIKLSVLYVTN